MVAIVNVISVGSFTVPVTKKVQPLASVTVTSYEPADNPVITAVVLPFDHK